MNPRPQAAAVLLFAALLALAGCASADVTARRSVYGKISLPPDAKNIGLTVARPDPEFALELPVSKLSAARSEAAAGAGAALSDPQSALLLPVCCALGGILGGVLGVGETELKTATEAIRAAVQELQFQERIAHAILEYVDAARPGFIRAIEENIPLEPPPMLGRMRREAGKRLTWTRLAPAPHPLVGSGIDTVIGIRVAFQGFQARTNPKVRSSGDQLLYNPPLTLVLSVDVSAVRVRDWADLGGMTIIHESQPRKFTEWAAGGAGPLRREMEATLQEINREVIAHLGFRR